MDDPRAQVARRVDRIAGCSTERQTDRKDDQADRQGVERAEPDLWLGDMEDGKDEDEGADQFAGEIRRQVANGRCGAEDTEFGIGVVGRGVRSAGDETTRAERVAIQCPKCRRKTALAA